MEESETQSTTLGTDGFYKGESPDLVVGSAIRARWDGDDRENAEKHLRPWGCSCGDTPGQLPR